MAVPEKVAEYLKEADPIPIHLELFTTKVGFLTGSRAFGVGAPDTDYDYVMFESQFRSMHVDACYEGGNYDFEGYRSWYLKCGDGKVFNVLSMKSKWYWDQYQYATQKILTNIRESKPYRENIKFKDFRVDEFEKYKALFAAGVRD